MNNNNLDILNNLNINNENNIKDVNIKDKNNKNLSKDYPLYLIYTSQNLTELYKFLLSFGDSSQIGVLRYEINKNGNSTNRVIALLDNKIYEECKEFKFHIKGTKEDFRIVPFKLSQNKHYPGKEFTNKIYLSLPYISKDNNSNNLNELRELIYKKLSPLINFKIIQKSYLNLEINESKHQGVDGYCIISFKEQVELEIIAITKLLLENTIWLIENSDKTQNIIDCVCKFVRKI